MVMCRHTLFGLVGPHNEGYGQARSGELYPLGKQGVLHNERFVQVVSVGQQARGTVG